MTAERKRVLFYGDSNTYGYDPRGFAGGRYPADQRWTEMVRRELQDSWEVMDDGMNGREIPSSQLTMQALDRTLRRCAPLDLFAVMLGSNDLLFSGPDPERAAGCMRQMLAHVTAFLIRHRRAEHCGEESGMEENRMAGECPILLIAPPEERSGGEVLRQASLRLAKLYREMAEEQGWMFLDLTSREISLAFDGLHFSEEGHRQMAGYIEEVLRA